MTSQAKTKVILRDARGGYVALSAQTVHTHECPAWRMGQSHGPCRCGADELWAKYGTEMSAYIESHPAQLPEPRVATKTKG